MSTINFGPGRVLVAEGFQTQDGVRVISGAGFPKSGTSAAGATGFLSGFCPLRGSIYIDTNTGVAFVNEANSSSAVYWTPVDFEQRGLMAYTDDFRNGAGKAVSDTATTATLVRSGVRIHGQGIDETDSGFTVAMSSAGAIGSLITTDEVAHTAVLSVGAGTTPMLKANVNGTAVMDANITNSSANTLRSVFFGLCASAADALDPILTYSGTTISFANTIADEIAGLTASVSLTDNYATWFAPHDKANTNASIETTATGVNTGVAPAAAGTYQRLRLELDADGTVRMFIDKTMVANFSAAITASTAVHPVIQIISTSTATKTLLVKRYSVWGVKA